MSKIITLYKRILTRTQVRLGIHPMGDDFGYIIPQPLPGLDPYNYTEIYRNLENIVKNYSLIEMKKIVGFDFGINPFDLFILKSFIEKNKVKNILELGAGTSSHMLDNMHIKRKSYSLYSMYYETTFQKLDIFKDYPKVQNYIKTHTIDMLLIDCEHSYRMAKLIYKKLLPITSYKLPIFVHDWHYYDEETFAEQVFYYKHLLDRYDVGYMSDLPSKYVKKLKALNNQIDNIGIYKKLNLVRENLPIPRCSAILIPKK